MERWEAMGRSRCLALVSLLLLVPSLFFVSPAAATTLHPDVVAFGGRRSLLQATPPTRATPAPATPPVTPPTRATPPPATPPVTPPTRATPPPATPPVTPPTRATPPPATPPVTPPTRATPPLTPPTPAAAPTPSTPTSTPVAAPGPAPVPVFAPAPAPIGVTNSQRRNAIIAGAVVGSVVVVALVLIFCRCRFMKRSKKLPFQRLQMT